MTGGEPTIFPKIYSLAQEVFETTMRLPKSQRFVIAQRLQNAVLDLLEAVTKAYTMRRKNEALQTAMAAVDRLRILLHLARDLNFVTVKACLRLHQQIDEIGRMLGGWIKHTGRVRQRTEMASASKGPAQ